MNSLQWKSPDLSDFKYLRENICDISLSGSDTSVVNIFLLQKKYDIKICIHNEIFFRYYTGSANRTGYLFPLNIKNEDSTKNFTYMKDALELIFEDAKARNVPVQFCLLTQTQKQIIDSVLNQNFPSRTATWNTTQDDSDYIYSRQNLAELKGKTYHKKKNHVSRFTRLHQGNWEFRSLNLCNISDDMLNVSAQWADEHDVKNDIVLQLEQESIKFAVQNKDAFGLEGGVLYIDGKPCAMTLASRISPSVLDVHFEKCLKHAADDGAYAAINWCFASSVPDFEFLNREEDMGVEGLRKAKLSYHPQIILEKFYGEID